MFNDDSRDHSEAKRFVIVIGRVFINIIAFNLYRYALGRTKPNAELRPAQIPLYNTTWSQNFFEYVVYFGTE